MAPLPSCSIMRIASCSWSPQSQRHEPKMSPVAHDECTRVSTGSSSVHSPLVSATCSSPLLFCRNGVMRKSPHAVGRSTVSPFSTMDSSRSRYSMSDAIEMILRPNFRAISVSCGRRAIVPSSFMISISAPAGCRPASRARSIAASVCPGRRSTPFWRARSGLMCPGRPRSVARVAGSARARMVARRPWCSRCRAGRPSQ